MVFKHIINVRLLLFKGYMVTYVLTKEYIQSIINIMLSIYIKKGE